MNLAQRETPAERNDQFLARPDTAPLVHEKVLSLLRSEKPGRLLDVPAGEGAFAERARALGHEVICGDLDPTRFHVEDLKCARLDLNSSWPYSPGSFDYVVSIEAVEHLENPWHYVKEARRVLKDHGILFLTTPNVLTIKSRLSYLMNGYPNYFHYMIEQDERGRERAIDHINPIGFLELRHVLARNGFVLDLIAANRYPKQASMLFQALTFFLKTRGRSTVRANPAKARVRQILLSKPLLFGEILILRCSRLSEND